MMPASTLAKACAAGATAGCVATLPTPLQLIAAGIGVVLALLCSAYEQRGDRELVAWAMVLLGRVGSSVSLGVIGAVSVVTLDHATLTDWPTLAAVLQWLQRLPEWCTPGGVGFGAYIVLPGVLERLKRGAQP